MSRPWKVRETSPRTRSGLVSSTAPVTPPSASAAQGSSPLSGPTSRPPGVSRATAAPGRAHPRVDHRRGVRPAAGARRSGRARPRPGYVAGMHQVGHVDHPDGRRQPGDHAVAGGDEAVGETVVGGEADPWVTGHARNGSADPLGMPGLRLPAAPAAGRVICMRLVYLHRTPAGRQLRRPAPGRPAHRGGRVRRLLPLRPLPGDAAGRATRPDRRLADPGRRWPARPSGSGSARWSRRPPSGCPARSRSASPRSTQMSGGRVELGLGAGWFDAEHAAYGIPFPPSASGSTGSTSSWR